MSQAEPMQQFDIDFLPEHYRQEFAQRKSQIWQFVGAAVAVVVLLVAAGVQWNNQRKLDVALETITPLHESAHERTVYLTTLKQDLAKVTARAELLTYLHHPWPKTQVLAAILEPLPASIKLSELSISRQETEAAPTVLPSQVLQDGTAASAEKQATPEPTELDLKALRSECDSRNVIVLLAGETTNVSELHQYLSSVARHPLISKAELKSIENSGREDQRTTFKAHIVVRPGYGQPHGPTTIPSESPQPPAQTSSPSLASEGAADSRS